MSERGLTQYEFAKRTGVGEKTVQTIELSGKISRGMAARISAKTGVNVQWLIANDPTKEIQNVAGKPWSNKDRQAFESRSRRWPDATIEIRKWQLKVCAELLQDYLGLRSFLESLPNPSEAADKWRSCKDSAVIGFLKSYRPAYEKAKAMSRRFKFTDLAGDETAEEVFRKGQGADMILAFVALQRSWPIMSPRLLQTVKDDVDAIMNVFPAEPTSEVGETVSLALEMGWELGEVLEVLDGMTDENKEERLAALSPIRQLK
jgi:transcriptional regulator with XRE-family HTH domain